MGKINGEEAEPSGYVRLTEAVGGVVGPEILENGIFDVADGTCSAWEGLNHEHLRALVDVDVAHGDV